MRRLQIFTLFLVLITALVAVFGCGSKQDNNSQGQSEENAKELIIGYTGPLSGPAAEYGQDNLNGLDMAINEINESGGITAGGQQYLFKLEKLDDMSDPTQAVNNARRLRDQFNSPAIFNPVFTTIAPLMDINEEPDNEFLIMGYTSTPAATEMGNSLFIDTVVSFSQYVRSFSEMAWEQGWRKGAMVVTLGAYGDEWRQAFKEQWESIGGEITADQPANYYTETDFSAQITAALSTNPDFLLIGGPSAPTALVIEQARTLGFDGGFILIDQAKPDYIIDEIFGDMKFMENVIGTAAVTDIPNKVGPAFNEEYTSIYNMHNTWEAILNYNAMHMLAMAMEKAGTVEDMRAIRAAFSELPHMTGDDYPAECFGVTEAGRVKVAAVVQMIQDGNYSDPYAYVWWTDTEEEFNSVKGFYGTGTIVKRITTE